MSQYYFEKSADAESFLQVFHTPGLGYSSCVKEYNKGNMPDKYQECTLAVDYKGPRYCAEMLTGVFIGNPAKARVLDIAAGTGLVGKELLKRGFCNVDAHDGAEAMVEFCKSLGFYKNFYVSFVGDGHRLPIKDDTYDAVTCCGATLENHLPSSAQTEFIRVIKPGGFFVNAHRANLPEIAYGQQWREDAQRLEDEGKWTLHGRLHFRNFNKYTDGSLDIYRPRSVDDDHEPFDLNCMCEWIVLQAERQLWLNLQLVQIKRVTVACLPLDSPSISLKPGFLLTCHVWSSFQSVQRLKRWSTADYSSYLC
ncbi:hypothetical protein RRG08_026063 [Elysia crispata]|uniref:Methyltransferase type 11 domain-containing protein n=1 Tax=Elysia crispata TaxID=231223 RepID=A0AAE0YRF4_9GAST|nr:hypothetical protein RRG08_026063 [Elysia crispata]